MKANPCYIFAAATPQPTPKSPGDPIALVRTEKIAAEICKLFRKSHSAWDDPVFHYLPQSTFDLGDQVLLDETLDVLEQYADPDPGLYDPPPEQDLIRQAQYAIQANRWADILATKLGASDADALMPAPAPQRAPHDREGGETRKAKDDLDSARASHESQEYQDFTTPENLTKLGRPLIKQFIEPFLEALSKAGLAVPSDDAPDFFHKLSKLLRDTERLPTDLTKAIFGIIETSRLLTAELRSQQDEEFRSCHEIVPLTKMETGRRLLSLLASVHGMHQDYPERLTAEQENHVGSLMDFLRDYADIADDLEPSANLSYERTVSDRIDEMLRCGLAIFAGKYKRITRYKDGTSSTWSVAVILVATANDLRIQKSADGDSLIQVAIPKRKRGPDPDSTPTQPQKSSATSTGTADTAAAAPINLFQRSGSVWRVVFGGSAEFHIPDTLGARYLNQLLHRPGHAIPARDLEVAITPEKANARSTTSIQTASDPEALRSYLKELNKLRANRDQAADQGDQNEVDRLDEEIGQLENVVRQGEIATGTGERARGNVSKAIKAVERSLAKGEQPEKAFGEHLKECVSKGYSFRYAHPTGGVWH